MMLTSENDFATGLVWGSVYKSLQTYTVVSESRQPTGEEIGDTSVLLVRRMDEIRNGLFSTG
jgi:hypothetical protein